MRHGFYIRLIVNRIALFVVVNSTKSMRIVTYDQCLKFEAKIFTQRRKSRPLKGWFLSLL